MYPEPKNQTHKTMYPIPLNASEPATKGPRKRKRSLALAAISITIPAHAYGGTDMSWAFAFVYPRVLMIVGRNTEIEDKATFKDW